MEMRTNCKRCSNELNNLSEAYISSYEYTYCKDSYHELKAVCSNCDGELVIRPKRKPKTN